MTSYLQTRFYNPNWGRFLNADALVSTGQGILGYNMFAYCANNPVCRKDIGGTTSQVCYNPEDVDFTDDNQNIDGGKMGNSGQYTFKSEASLNEHFNKHNSEFGNAFSNPQEYADAANYVIQSGEYVASQNAYVKFYGMNGRANYAFVGMSHDLLFITTFHLKHVSQIQF